MIIKLLLLGSGESGKSTLFKQMKLIYNEKELEKELNSYKGAIYSNIIVTLSSLSKYCKKKDIGFENEDNFKNSFKIEEIAEAQQDDVCSHWTPEIASFAETIWKDKAIQQALTAKSELHIFDGAEHFFSNLERFRDHLTYKVTVEDALYCRRKTTGLIQFNFEIDSTKFSLSDVGGQRNERKKWKNIFQDVTAVIFVVSLSEFDQTCYEDDITNRMTESLELFSETVNNSHFANSTILLFFNKIDIFREKIKKVELSNWFKDYKGSNTFEDGIAYISSKYLDQNKGEPGRIHVHQTIATSSK
jgi:GTPase SAR1 family protein